MTTTEDATRPLNDIMEFDHVIEVHADGSITHAPSDVYAPDVVDNALQAIDTPWSLMDGYSGQQSYSGPIMHPSEYIGGRLEDDIRATPGYYVALVAHFTTDAEGSELGPDDDDVDGWAVAFCPVPEVGAPDAAGEKALPKIPGVTTVN